MEKLIGKNKINCAIFISGRGSNLNSLIKYSKNKKSLILISLVITNNKYAKGLHYSKSNKIKSAIINYNNKYNAESKILKILKKNNIKLICLAGFMKVLSKKFILNFKHPILNIHPSLLPKHKGLNTHQKVLENKEKFTGCTVHIVNHKIDSGKILLQKRIKIFKNDTIKSLERRVLNQEHKLYPLALKKIFTNL